MRAVKSASAKVHKESKDRNWALPNHVVSEDEVRTAIQDAEKGTFHTIQESMAHFEQWLESRKKR